MAPAAGETVRVGTTYASVRRVEAGRRVVVDWYGTEVVFALRAGWRARGARQVGGRMVMFGAWR